MFVNLVGWLFGSLFCDIVGSIQVKIKLISEVFTFEPKLTVSYKEIIDVEQSLSVSFSIKFHLF